VTFAPATGNRGTLVAVDLEYLPPAGKLGAVVAKLFGEEPGQQVAGDLRRFKWLMETGEVIRSDAALKSRKLFGQRPARPAGTPGMSPQPPAFAIEPRRPVHVHGDSQV
jgi:hypothetical protein